MNGYFEHFPQASVCPICRGNQDIGTVLVAVDGTIHGSLQQAIPVHASCILQSARFNPETGSLRIEHKPMQLPLIDGMPPVPVEGGAPHDTSPSGDVG